MTNHQRFTTALLALIVCLPSKSRAEGVLEPPVSEVSGRVVDASSGEALAGVKVDLVTLRDAVWSDGWLKRGDGWQYRTDYKTTSDSMGVFVLREVAGGHYRLRVKHGEYGGVMTEIEVGSVPVRDVDIALGSSDGLVLKPSQETSLVGTWIRVALLDQAGRMVLMNNQKVGADGKTHFVSPPIGDWQLWVSSANSAWARIDVRIPGEEVAVALTPGSGVVFKVPELGYDLGDLTISLRSPDGRPLPDVLGSGTVKSMDDMGYVDNLWPGRWSLTLHHEDGRTWHEDFTLRAGKTTRLELR